MNLQDDCGSFAIDVESTSGRGRQRLFHDFAHLVRHGFLVFSGTLVIIPSQEPWTSIAKEPDCRKHGSFVNVVPLAESYIGSTTT